MRALLIGAVESTRVALRALADAPGWTLAGLVTLPLDLAGRHSDFVDLEAEARAIGCPVLRTANANAEEARTAIAALAPDYLFVIGWSQLCGEAMRALAPGRVVGYHPAPLPRLRGRGVIPWTILLDEPITAGTLFLIDEGTDSGAILAQNFFHVAPDETGATLYARHMAALEAMLPGLLSSLAAGTVEPRPQDERYATWAARRRPEDGVIDWRDDAVAIWRTVRACGDPYPGAWTMLGEERLVILKAEPVDLSHHRAALAGQVVERSEQGFTVRCGDGWGVLVTEWRGARPSIHVRLRGA
ncbi:MAG: methionyl-tRNA formyltransferase [Sphingomonas oligoaromativorans]